MKDKVWDIEYQGHHIRVINKVSFLPPKTSEVLEVDNVIVVDKSGSFLRTYSSIFTHYDFNGIARNIEVRFAPKKKIMVGCQIFVDNIQVGGDRSIAYPDPLQISQQLAAGFWRYFLSVGLLNYGLPYATMMAIFEWGESASIIAKKFVIHQLVFGLLMSYSAWEGLKQMNRDLLQDEIARDRGHR
jgi:hypothetical protein